MCEQQFPTDLVKFTEEIFNGKLHFLSSVSLTLLIIVSSTAHAMLHISELLKVSRFKHLWTLQSETFRRFSEQVIAKP